MYNVMKINRQYLYSTVSVYTGHEHLQNHYLSCSS